MKEELQFDPSLKQMLVEYDAATIGGEESDRAGRDIAVIARLHQPDRAVPGLTVVSRFGTVVTGRLDLRDVPAVRLDRNVASLKANQYYGPHPTDYVATDEVSRRDIFAGSAAVDSAAGRGVIVGVTDWGCDVGHANLCVDGRTRFLKIWDQRGGQTATSPQPYGYGREFSSSEIDAAISTGDPYRAMAYDPAQLDPAGRGMHGTHVLDIAAGGGVVPGSLAGVAPEAHLVFVHLRAHGTGPLQNLGDSSSLLEGIDYIFKLADRLELPAVVNCSLGRTAGPHDASVLTSMAVDALLVERSGRAVVMSAGNYHDAGMHVNGVVPPAGVVDLHWEAVAQHDEFAKMDIWYGGSDTFSVSLTDPSGTTVASAELGTDRVAHSGDAVVASIFHRRKDPNNGDNQVELFLWPSAALGEWTVRLSGRDVVSGRYHAWIERDDSSSQSRFSRSEVTTTTTTNTICNGRLSLAVAAYEDRLSGKRILPFSSAGPTRDGRRKPDIAAAGGGIVAARSTIIVDGNRLMDGLTVKSGTSMAAPQVTGTVALMFQVALPDRLPIAMTRRLLLGSAQPAARASEDKPERYGAGCLDVAGAVSAVRSATSAPTEVMTHEGAPMVVGDAAPWPATKFEAVPNGRGSGSQRALDWLGESLLGEDIIAPLAGLDVSHHQGNIDWPRVAAAGMAFGFAKATEGGTYQDPAFTRNWAGMDGAGVLRGAYHFFRPNIDATTQAQSFLRVVPQLQGGDLPPVLDVERTDGVAASTILGRIDEWLRIVETALKRRPIIYTGPSFWHDQLGNSSRFVHHPLWIAQYTNATQPRLPGGWPWWDFWQHTDHGQVPGVSGHVDLNKFNGSLDRLLAFAAAALV